MGKKRDWPNGLPRTDLEKWPFNWDGYGTNATLDESVPVVRPRECVSSTPSTAHLMHSPPALRPGLAIGSPTAPVLIPAIEAL